MNIKKYLILPIVLIIILTVYFLLNTLNDYSIVGNSLHSEKYGSNYCNKNCTTYYIYYYDYERKKDSLKAYKKVDKKNIKEIKEYYNNFKNTIKKKTGYEIDIQEDDINNNDYFIFSTENNKNILYYFNTEKNELHILEKS